MSNRSSALPSLFPLAEDPPKRIFKSNKSNNYLQDWISPMFVFLFKLPAWVCLWRWEVTLLTSLTSLTILTERTILAVVTCICFRQCWQQRFFTSSHVCHVRRSEISTWEKKSTQNCHAKLFPDDFHILQGCQNYISIDFAECGASKNLTMGFRGQKKKKSLADSLCVGYLEIDKILFCHR